MFKTHCNAFYSFICTEIITVSSSEIQPGMHMKYVSLMCTLSRLSYLSYQRQYKDIAIYEGRAYASPCATAAYGNGDDIKKITKLLSNIEYRKCYTERRCLSVCFMICIHPVYVHNRYHLDVAAQCMCSYCSYFVFRCRLADDLFCCVPNPSTSDTLCTSNIPWTVGCVQHTGMTNQPLTHTFS
jgi:hypothetical protein